MVLVSNRPVRIVYENNTWLRKQMISPDQLSSNQKRCVKRGKHTLANRVYDIDSDYYKLDLAYSQGDWYALKSDLRLVFHRHSNVEISQSLTELDISDLCREYVIKEIEFRSVIDAESIGDGFVSGRPYLQYSGSLFNTFSNNLYATSHPTLGLDIILDVDASYVRLNAAKLVDDLAANSACSWGKFSLCAGLLHTQCGFSTVQSFVDAMYENEYEQTKAFLEYLKYLDIIKHVNNHRWSDFAKVYHSDYQFKVQDKRLYDCYLAKVQENAGI